MKSINIDAQDEKIYKFVKKKYFQIYSLYYIGHILLLLILVACFHLYFNSNFLHGYIIGYVLGLIINYLIVSKYSESNYICFKHENDSYKAEVLLCARRIEKTYEFNKISKLRRNNFYIKVVGEINGTKTHFYKGYSSRFKKKHLRISAYFENMDEIYSELEKLKYQSALS